MEIENKETKKGFGYRLRLGLGFLVNVDFHLATTFILLILSQMPYYMIMGRIITRLMSLTSDQMMEVLTGEGVGTLLGNGEQTTLTVAMVVSVVMTFFFSMYYAVMFLRQCRHPGPTEVLLFRPLIGIIIVLSLRAVIFAGLYYMCNVSLFFLLVLLLRPISIFATCCRADSQQTLIMSIRSAFSVMKGQMLRSALYTLLSWLIITSAGTLTGAIISSVIPDYSVMVFAIAFAVTNTVYIITYTRIFTSMYADTVPGAGEESELKTEELEQENHA